MAVCLAPVFALSKYATLLCTGYVLCGGVDVMYVVYVYIVEGRYCNIPDMFHIYGLVMICVW
jgi:hypothetical protein